ncbi:MAG: phosphate-binding protein [Firmicutes bacterium HGW-Firmicutes-2]|jgi:phosphate transport system substrate-binding protein|nr:MAG: phosphate-binding protein [Firmicutes bacterium HGW-Firmicutes-2]
MKKLLALILALSLITVLAGCGTDTTTEADTTPDTAVETPEATEPVAEATATEIEGTVTISGSTSVEKVGLGLAEEFMALNPSVTVTYESIGSSGGVKNANEGVTMIGTASREIKDTEKEWGMTEAVIAFDGIAVAVNPANGVTEITKDQVAAIYKGEITNWSEVGGADEDIVVVSREDGSGTRGAFEEILDFEGALTVNALIAEGNGNVQTTVASNPQAIGYISFSTINNTIVALKVDGAEATMENVLNQTFPISRPFNIVYHDANLSDAAKAFVEFIFTAEGQAVVEEKGGIPVK